MTKPLSGTPPGQTVADIERCRRLRPTQASHPRSHRPCLDYAIATDLIGWSCGDALAFEPEEG